MDSLTLPILKNASDSSVENGSSSSNTTNQMMDLESGRNMNHELIKPTLGVWQYPTNLDHCCIYRVPLILRQENPKAYTPQLILIGPLHYPLKSQALMSHGDTTKEKLMGYLNMEEHKKTYLKAFGKRVEGSFTIDDLRRLVKEDEARIRESYSESTEWIESPKFVEMILHDSVFILEFMLRFVVVGSNKIGDPLMDNPCLVWTITRVLENQLPYFILEKLFALVVKILKPTKTLHELVIYLFGLGNTESVLNSKFRHFTDLMRCVRVDTLPDRCLNVYKGIGNMYNAEKLHNGGVKFKVVEGQFSMYVEFDHGCLKIPSLFDFLINTEKDVDLLVGKEIIKNCIGDNGAVAKMVNKLCLGILEFGSYYSDIGTSVKTYYDNQCHRSYGILRHVYFNNLWRGTATVAAACILLLTLTQTVTSIISIIKKK